MADENGLSRKTFVLLGTSAVAAIAGAETARADAAPHVVAAASPAPAHAKPLLPLGTQPEAYTYFTQPEHAFVEAAVERLIPSDDLGPGGREAGVAYFIDQQLDGQFGYAAKMYMQGPWAPGLPTQGYQLPLTPREVYRLGIAGVNAYCQKQYGNNTFDALTPGQQDTVLTGLDQATIVLDAVPAKVFFEMLYANAIEGFFSDPIYGGNRDKIGWKLVGFPGAAAAYANFIEKHNVAYKVAPVSIADVQQAEQAAMDGGSGMQMDDEAMHRVITAKALGVH
ncbi:MAG TPA: gluconate 2-dehydrogenase subunit 3 family protein [Candidatus Sulfotelmatobacter sp.]|nr:gluconate 2-dehydrogenase subunit 3 family protein [Candidatus Sulfotelmatobacter sp.]